MLGGQGNGAFCKDGESDFVTIYAHLNEVHVKKGDKTIKVP